MNNRWIIYPKKSNNIINQILLNRGIDLQLKKKFLDPDYMRDLLDPFLIKDMEKAVKIIKNSIKNHEKIGIFADYDADGIPGAALFYKLMSSFNLQPEVYIPSREEGYGLNKKGVEELAQKGCKILISVDLGITSKKEVEFAKKLGMKVIITDHHEIQKNLFPDNADAVIHTHLSKKYKNKDLAGGAVVYKIAQALGKKLGRPNERELKWLLDLPAISTICDIVPLTGENRVIAKYGLIVLSKTKNLGLKKLYQVSTINQNLIDTYTVGFLIGPRINAPGRMDHAQASYYLLTTKDKAEALRIAEKLNNINLIRQKSLEKLLIRAKKQIKETSLDKEKIIVIRGKNWPVGVVGLVASKITEEYNRPSIVFSESDGVLRGSARSIDKFHLVMNLKKLEKYLVSLGGHAKAAGLSLKIADYQRFYRKICALAKQKILDEDLIKKIRVDAIIDVKDLTLNLVQKLKKFEPFGLGNPRPTFMIKNMMISDLRWVGKEKNHLKIKASQASKVSEASEVQRKQFDAIGFGMNKLRDKIHSGDIIDIVFSLSENVWQGRKRLDLKINDLRISKT